MVRWREFGILPRNNTSPKPQQNICFVLHLTSAEPKPIVVSWLNDSETVLLFWCLQGWHNCNIYMKSDRSLLTIVCASYNFFYCRYRRVAHIKQLYATCSYNLNSVCTDLYTAGVCDRQIPATSQTQIPIGKCDNYFRPVFTWNQKLVNSDHPRAIIRFFYLCSKRTLNCLSDIITGLPSCASLAKLEATQSIMSYNVYVDSYNLQYWSRSVLHNILCCNWSCAKDRVTVLMWSQISLILPVDLTWNS